MFRLFLIDRLVSASEVEKADQSRKNTPPSKRLRNRRVYDRFNIDSKHIALLNDQDILPIRDVSEFGFSTEVSDRGFQRLLVGDVYRCRIRYMQEIYDIDARIAWKAKQFVGWTIARNNESLRPFFDRLIKPLDIAMSLQKVTTAGSHDDRREWYQGIRDTSLFIWLSEHGSLKAWQLESQATYLEWDVDAGLSSGKSFNPEKVLDTTDPWKPVHLPDPRLNHETKQFATDVFMALQISYRDEIIGTLVDH
jgi:hypothetical protein